MTSNNDRNLIVEVADVGFGINAYIRIKNIKTGKILSKEMNFWSLINNHEKLFTSLQSMININKIKAFVFNVSEMEMIPPLKSYEFRKRCIKFCEQNNISCFFMDEILIFSLGAISSTKTMVNEGEKILIIRPVGFGSKRFVGCKLIREKERFRLLEDLPYNSVDEFCINHLNDFIPKKVIIVADPLQSRDIILDELKLSFKKYSPYLLLKGQDELNSDALVMKVLHSLGENISKYDVAFTCRSIYNIRVGNKSLFKVEKFEALPYVKSVVVEDVGTAKCVMLFQEFEELPPTLIEEINISSLKTKNVKVSFKIDYNEIHDLKVEEIEDDKILSTNISKARFVFGKQYFSVVIFDENAKEYLLEDSDGSCIYGFYYFTAFFEGLEKTPIYISFEGKKPVIGKAAMEQYCIKREFVVFDLIRLCSVQNAEIINPKWGFRFFEDSGTLKVIMENDEGGKVAEIGLLLALFLRNGIKRIKTNFEKIMDEIEIQFDGFVPNEILKNNFVKAGEDMKVKILIV